MLALADPDIVAREVDTLLKIGLGHFGTTDLELARYTCIALQRLNIKQKKGFSSLIHLLNDKEPSKANLQRSCLSITPSLSGYGL
jgi:hypothetical protein